jgi:dTDP-4-dehydrorhamnose reductase
MGPFRRPYLVIGSKGMLGTDLMGVLGQSGVEAQGLDLPEVDITREDSVISALEVSRAGTLINVAAYTDVDGCESNQELAFNVNAQAPGLLARICKASGCALVHIGTDYVFDGGARRPYKEEDPVNPLGVYGKTKAQSEDLVRELLPDNHCIVRTAWLYGSHGKNFVETILGLARQRDVLRVVDDQRGTPTYTLDLAAALARLCEKGGRGTFHVTNSGETTWYEFANRIIRRSGITGVRVEPISTAELGRPAPRPAYSLMDNGKFAALTGTVLRPWEEALDEYLARRPGRLQ